MPIIIVRYHQLQNESNFRDVKMQMICALELMKYDNCQHYARIDLQMSCSHITVGNALNIQNLGLSKLFTCGSLNFFNCLYPCQVMKSLRTGAMFHFSLSPILSQHLGHSWEQN